MGRGHCANQNNGGRATSPCQSGGPHFEFATPHHINQTDTAGGFTEEKRCDRAHKTTCTSGDPSMVRNTGQVTFRWRDSADGNRQKLMTINAVEFIRSVPARLMPHPPNLSVACARSAFLYSGTLLRRSTPDQARGIIDTYLDAGVRHRLTGLY